MVEHDCLDAAIADLAATVRADGVDLRLVSYDTATSVVEIGLELGNADCPECVLSPDDLEAVVAAGLRQRANGDYRVVVRDPRRVRDSAAALPSMVTVIDPTGSPTVAALDPGPDAGSLRSRVVGVRLDILWRSWDWIAEEWAAALGGHGCEIIEFRRAQGLAGSEGEKHHAEFRQFVRSADVAILGLANCGSCTSWTIKDAVAAANAGLPTVAAVTEQFVPLARTLASRYGRPGLRLVELPFPLDMRPEREVRAIARETLPALLEALGVTA